MAQEELITPAEAALLKGVSRTGIYSAISEGRLPSRRALGRLALSKADVMAWTPTPYSGRPKGIPVSDETRSKMSEAQRKRRARFRSPLESNRGLGMPSLPPKAFGQESFYEDGQ